MNLRFHWMLPKGGEVAMQTVQETSRVLTTKSSSKASLPDMEGVFTLCGGSWDRVGADVVQPL
jgi:hypothetical protein